MITKLKKSNKIDAYTLSKLSAEAQAEICKSVESIVSSFGELDILNGERREEREPKSYGYARVSTKEQEGKLQVEKIKSDLHDIGDEDIFFDHGVSGTINPLNREVFQELLKKMQRGDSLYIYADDRLSRDPLHLEKCIDIFRKEGMKLYSLNMGIGEHLDLTSYDFSLDTIRALKGRMAQYERQILLQRTRAGKEASGNWGGRPKWEDKHPKEAVEELIRLRKEEGLTLKEIEVAMKEFGAPIVDKTAGRILREKNVTARPIKKTAARRMKTLEEVRRVKPPKSFLERGVKPIPRKESAQCRSFERRLKENPEKFNQGFCIDWTN